MKRYLFANFLQSREAYEQCRRYWSTLVDSIATSLGQSGDWKPWMPKVYGDGKTAVEMDGNPIFDAHSSRIERAFQISQDPPDPGMETYGIGFWLSSDEDPGALPRHRLGISVVLDKTLQEPSGGLALVDGSDNDARRDERPDPH
jgi:hypothetical protein